MTGPPLDPTTRVEPPPATASEPAPARRRSTTDDPGRLGSIVFGLVVLAIGLWFFADQTLGLDLPRIRWNQVWPLFIIGLGVWIALGSLRRGSR
jgi:hypothetical protein